MGQLMGVLLCVMVAMVMMMRMLTYLAAQPQLLAPGSREHPKSDRDDQEVAASPQEHRLGHGAPGQR